MRMNIQILFIVLLLTITAGCSSTNVSDQEPYSLYVNQASVTLQHPVVVVQRGSMWSSGSGGVRSLRRAQFGLRHAPMVREEDRIFAQLPVGHSVQIDRVVDEVFIDGQQIVAYGRTSIPPSTNLVTFAYDWGFIWNLEPAPWEPLDTPRRRYVGRTSR